MIEDDPTSLTTAKTLWSETILEILYQSLKLGKPDDEITDLLKDVRDKGFEPDYIIEKVEKNVDKNASTRVRALLKNS